MSAENFVTLHSRRWFWAMVVLCVVLAVAFCLQRPVGGSNGGTVFGYVSGTIGALGMIFLMWYAARKRSYSSTAGTLRAWLGGHIWVGSALLIIVPLHTGFKFGMNMHTTLAVLTLLTVVTGIWGMFLFVAIPPRMEGRRRGITLRSALSEIRVITADMGVLVKGKSAPLHRILNLVDFDFRPDILKVLIFNTPLPAFAHDGEVADEFRALSEADQQEALKLMSLARKKREVCQLVLTEARDAALLRGWLYLHVPLATATFGLLIIHVVSVFYRW